MNFELIYFILIIILIMIIFFVISKKRLSKIKEKFNEEIEIIKLSEAQHYRETQSIIRELEAAKDRKVESDKDKYPESLF